MQKKFKSTHNLPFLTADYEQPFKDGFNWRFFKIGTIEGIFAFRDETFWILAIENKEKNNGHFTDVLDWFEQACKRDHCNLVFLEIWNKPFFKHLIEKRGFEKLGENAIKVFE